MVTWPQRNSHFERIGGEGPQKLSQSCQAGFPPPAGSRRHVRPEPVDRHFSAKTWDWDTSIRVIQRPESPSGQDTVSTPAIPRLIRPRYSSAVVKSGGFLRRKLQNLMQCNGQSYIYFTQRRVTFFRPACRTGTLSCVRVATVRAGNRPHCPCKRRHHLGLHRRLPGENRRRQLPHYFHRVGLRRDPVTQDDFRS